MRRSLCILPTAQMEGSLPAAVEMRSTLILKYYKTCLSSDGLFVEIFLGHFDSETTLTSALSDIATAKILVCSYQLQ